MALPAFRSSIPWNSLALVNRWREPLDKGWEKSRSLIWSRACPQAVSSAASSEEFRSRLSCARRSVERGVASSWCMWSARERARTSSTSDVNCLVIVAAPHDHHCAASETTLLPPPEVSLVVALASPITFLIDSMTSAAWPLMCVLLRLTREWGKRRNKNTLTLLVWS